MIPRRTNTSMNFAVSAITTRSQASASCMPPPAAVPFTAPMTGRSQSRIDAMSRCHPVRMSRATSPGARSGAPSGFGRRRPLRAAERGAGAEVAVPGAPQHDHPHPQVLGDLDEAVGQPVPHRRR